MLNLRAYPYVPYGSEARPRQGVFGLGGLGGLGGGVGSLGQLAVPMTIAAMGAGVVAVTQREAIAEFLEEQLFGTTTAATTTTTTTTTSAPLITTEKG